MAFVPHHARAGADFLEACAGAARTPAPDRVYSSTGLVPPPARAGANFLEASALVAGIPVSISCVREPTWLGKVSWCFLCCILDSTATIPIPLRLLPSPRLAFLSSYIAPSHVV